MILRLLIELFGGIWKLKAKCRESVTNRLLNTFYVSLYRIVQHQSGSSIAWNCHLEDIPCLPHGMQGIFISQAARIGKNCVIFQQVTIGSNTLPDSNKVGAPVIGDNCYIGAGAKIIGNVRIGNNCRIGANCAVYRDVPANSIVVSGRQHVIQKDFLVNKFYLFRDKWVYYNDGAWVDETDEEILTKLSGASGPGKRTEYRL